MKCNLRRPTISERPSGTEPPSLVRDALELSPNGPSPLLVLDRAAAYVGLRTAPTAAP